VNEETIREIIGLLRDNPDWVPWAVAGASAAVTLHLLSRQQQQPQGMTAEEMLKLMMVAQQMQYPDMQRVTNQTRTERQDETEERITRLEMILMKMLQEEDSE